MGLIKLAIIGGAGYWALQKYKQNQGQQGYCGRRRNGDYHNNDPRWQQHDSQEQPPLQFREPEVTRRLSLPDEKGLPRDYKSQQHLYYNDSQQVVPYETSPPYQPVYPSVDSNVSRQQQQTPPQYPDVIDNLISRSKEFIEGLEKQRQRDRKVVN